MEATLSLHDEQGITGTSVRNVAGRAGVSPATVLQHFPRMDELIRACGELSEQLAPMPTEVVCIGAETEIERVRRMALALFEWFEQLGPGFDHLRIDRRHLPELDAWLAEVDRRHRALAAMALAGADRGRIDLLVAITTVDAWRALRDSGMDPRRAAGQVSQLVGQGPATGERYH